MTLFADTLVAKCHSLVHAEAVLFVDNDQSELVKIDAFLEERMGTNDQLCGTVRDSLDRLPTCRRTLTAREPRRVDAKRS